MSLQASKELQHKHDDRRTAAAAEQVLLLSCSGTAGTAIKAINALTVHKTTVEQKTATNCNLSYWRECRRVRTRLVPIFHAWL